MQRMRVKDVSIKAHNIIVMGDQETAFQMPGIDKRIWNLVREKFKLGNKDKHCPGSTWGAFCAIECMLRYLYFRDVKTAIDVQNLLRDYNMGGNRAAENYTFGEDAVFVRTVPLHSKLELDYKRVLNGCTSEDSLEKVISQLYQFVLPEKSNAFRDAAKHVFGVSL